MSININNNHTNNSDGMVHCQPHLAQCDECDNQICQGCMTTNPITGVRGPICNVCQPEL
jgi:hypothetical protein